MTYEDRNLPGLLPLLEAITAEDIDTMADLLSGAPALVRAEDGEGLTPLHVAARDGKSHAASLLLARGAPLEALDRVHGSTALGWAAYFGHLTVVRCLLDAGADASFVNMYGLSPLQIAAGGARGEHPDAPARTPADFQEIVTIFERRSRIAPPEPQGS